MPNLRSADRPRCSEAARKAPGAFSPCAKPIAKPKNTTPVRQKKMQIEGRSGWSRSMAEPMQSVKHKSVALSTIGCDGCGGWLPLADARLSQSEADALTSWRCCSACLPSLGLHPNPSPKGSRCTARARGGHEKVDGGGFVTPTSDQRMPEEQSEDEAERQVCLLMLAPEAGAGCLRAVHTVGSTAPSSPPSSLPTNLDGDGLSLVLGPEHQGDEQDDGELSWPISSSFYHSEMMRLHLLHLQTECAAARLLLAMRYHNPRHRVLTEGTTQWAKDAHTGW